MQRSIEQWRALETETDHSLLDLRGVVYIAPHDHPMLRGVEHAADHRGLSLERLDRDATMGRFPGYVLPDGAGARFEPSGGVFEAPPCLDALGAVAQRHGTDLRYGCRVRALEPMPGGDIRVTTEKEVIEAGAAVLTAGPWAHDFLQDLALPITVRRKTCVFTEPMAPSLFDAASHSVNFWASTFGVFAGFPHRDGLGVMTVRHDGGDLCTPEPICRSVRPDDLDEASAFFRRHMPRALGRIRHTSVVLYTMTPDNHFIVDRHPGITALAFAARLCGHGFKFAQVIGEGLADLALEGSTALPIDLLGAGRFAARVA